MKNTISHGWKNRATFLFNEWYLRRNDYFLNDLDIDMLDNLDQIRDRVTTPAELDAEITGFVYDRIDQALFPYREEVRAIEDAEEDGFTVDPDEMSGFIAELLHDGATLDEIDIDELAGYYAPWVVSEIRPIILDALGIPEQPPHVAAM